MKLRNKLLMILLSLSMSIPTFAMVQIPDTFTYGNISDTFSGTNDNSVLGRTNMYIIASDNTIMAKGPSAQGLGSSAVNTNDAWKPVIKGANGVTLNNVVKVEYGVTCPYALDSSGNAYYINGYPQKIEIEGEEGIKFKDVGETYYKARSGTVTLTYLVSEEGDLYKGTGANFTKVADVSDIDSICISYPLQGNQLGYYTGTTIALLKTKNKEVYKATHGGVVTKMEGVTDVSEIYAGYSGAYLKFESGVVGYTGISGSTVKNLDIPKDEEFLGIFGTLNIVGLVTDKNVYKLSETTLTKGTAVNTVDESPIRPITSKGDLAVDNQGKYYTWKLSGNEFQFTPVEGIEEWANENPIVLESELANFDIPLNKIFKRLENYEFTFNLVTKEQPKKFNIYFCKNEDRNDKLKWQLIEGNVDVSTLNPEVYDTGYVNASGKPITGFSYKYDWQVGDEDLVGVHLIVEPIYN